MNPRLAVALHSALRGGASGFTLVELVIVLILIGIVAAVAVPRATSSAAVRVGDQAQKLASDLRRTQYLASNTSRSLCIRVTASTYYVSEYVTSGNSSACSDTAISDPLVGTFQVSIESGVSIQDSLAEPLRFRSNAAPSRAATYTVGGGGRSVTVTVTAVSGEVTVSGG